MKKSPLKRIKPFKNSLEFSFIIILNKGKQKVMWYNQQAE